MKAPEVVRKNDNVRVVVRTAAELFDEGKDDKGKYVGGKWGGLYLRAPDIFFRILEKAGDKLVRLGDVAEVRRGFTTGANDFFYLEVLPYLPVCPLCGVVHEDALTKEEERRYWLSDGELPQESLVAVGSKLGWEGYLESSALALLLRSPTEIRSWKVEPQDLELRVFLPSDLTRHAAAYVKFGQEVEIVVGQGANKGQRIVGVHLLRTLKSRNPWWRLSTPTQPPNLVCMMSYNDRFGFFLNTSAFVDNRLYTIKPNEPTSLVALFYALNWPFTFLQQELLGRSNLGEGALDLKVYEVEQLLIPHPRLIQEQLNRAHSLNSVGLDEPQESFARVAGNILGINTEDINLLKHVLEQLKGARKARAKSQVGIR